MSNMLMIHHAATRNRETDDRPGMIRGDYDRENRIPDDRPGMEHETDIESRYRGRDGRWRAGTRRSEYAPNMNEDYRTSGRRDPDDRRMGDDDEEGRKYKIEVLPSNVGEWPRADPDRGGDYRTNRQIGFGAMNQMPMNEGRSSEHHHMERGTADMEPMEFDRETAEHWVRSMRNEDKTHPVGGKWSPDMLKPLAQKYGLPTDGKKFWEFYAMTNAMYSDYGEVAKKFGITSPEFYACMAKAWMEDKDAEPDKTALYYEYIVKKGDYAA